MFSRELLKVDILAKRQFGEFPEFSKQYYLYGADERAIRSFFSEAIVRFFEIHEGIHVECHKHKLLIYKKRDLLDAAEIQNLEKFAEEFLLLVNQKQKSIN